MVRIWTMILAVALWGGLAAAQDRDGIEDVITRQLDAFNDRDVDTAWSFASPTIQGIFGNASTFGTMVEQGYPMVWTNRDARFLEFEERGGRLYQRVLIRDEAGARHVVEYEMVEIDGAWRINGARILPAPDIGV